MNKEAARVHRRRSHQQEWEQYRAEKKAIKKENTNAKGEIKHKLKGLDKPEKKEGEN